MNTAKTRVLNPVTGRSVDVESKTGRLIMAVRRAKEGDGDLNDVSDFEDLKNPDRYIYHPIKKTPVKRTTEDGEVIDKVFNGPDVPEGYVFNAVTANLVKRKPANNVYTCNLFKERDRDYVFSPLPHQKETVEYFDRIGGTDVHGLLLNFGLGTGKTCTSIMAIDLAIDLAPDKIVYVFVLGSLRQNFLREYCVKCGKDPARVSKNIRIITFNYSLVMSRLPKKEDMDGSVVIIDEFHRISQGYTNDSENAVAILNLLYSLENAQFLLLTGTPISSTVEQMYFTMRLLLPKAFESLTDFMGHYEKDDEGRYVMDEYVRDAYSYCVCTYQPEDDPENYPTMTIQFVAVEMTEYQAEAYETILGWERKVIKTKEVLRYTRPEMWRDSKAMEYIRTTMLKSRQYCNMRYPPDVETKIFGVFDDETGKRIRPGGDSKGEGSKGEGSKEDGSGPPDRLVEDGGWITSEFVENLHEYAPKFHLIVERIMEDEGKHVVYSEFKTRYGVYLLSAVLKAKGVSCLTFTGDLSDEQRESVLSRFNDPDNATGRDYKVLLITDAGSIGNSYLAVQYLHVCEQSVNEFDTQQVMGRIHRYKAFRDLPGVNSQITLRYFAEMPGGTTDYVDEPDLDDEYQTSDFIAYSRGMKKVLEASPTIEYLASLPVSPLSKGEETDENPEDADEDEPQTNTIPREKKEKKTKREKKEKKEKKPKREKKERRKAEETEESEVD